MQMKRTLVAVAALSAPAAPAVAMAATGSDTTHHRGPVAKSAAAHVAAHRKAAKRNVRLARIRAHRAGRKFRVMTYTRRAKARSLEDLQRSNRRLRLVLKRIHKDTALVVRLRPTLRAIAACESGHNPRAISASGTYRGLFQFDGSAWNAAGGSGDPAQATVAEQYLRAAITYTRRGAQPWPVCGR
jgi:hypothetical protein